MEKQFFATIKIDMDSIDEKVKAVIEAKERLDEAIRELRDATEFDKTEIVLHGTQA